MAIERTLLIATSYVTKDEHDDLNAGVIDWPMDKYDYGWRVWVPSFPDLDENEMEDKLAADGETPCPSLIPLIRYANEHGCAWVRLDCDADTDLPDTFPTYDW